MSTYNSKELILASASPRRKELLENLGLSFKTIPSDADETIDNNITPDEAVQIIAKRKAEDIIHQVNYPAIIIGCDTTVVIDNKTLGKPIDFDDAFSMLKTLSGRSHRVVSGVVVIDTKDNKLLSESVSSEVIFRELTDEEIINYIKTGEPMDKAGAYAIQGLAGTFVSKINGCYSNIVGLPISCLSEMLKQVGIDIMVETTNNNNI